MNASVYPTMEVEVCSWWSTTLSRTGSIGNVTILGNSYEVCSQTATSSNGLTSWPTFIFVSNVNLLTVAALDLMMFLRYAHQNLQLLSGYYASGIYFGYRIYKGKGNFIYTSDPQLQIVDIPVPPPPLPPPTPPSPPSPSPAPPVSPSLPPQE